MLNQSVPVSSKLDRPYPRFDIFKLTPEHHFVWIEAAETLGGALTRASALCERGSDTPYMVFRQDTQRKIFVSLNDPIKSEP